MAPYFRSTQIDPHARGQEFGKAHESQIHANITIYKNMFAARGASAVEVTKAGHAALRTTQSFAPDLHAEMLGMAQGASIEPALIGMLNARTEILAMIGAKTRGECSAVIHVPSAIGVQTWDWYYALRNSWLLWEIPLADGSVTKTMTEYGIVGKAGMNTRGIGLLFTILHHAHDGLTMGVPVHVISRFLLDTATGAARAAKLATRAKVSASSSLNIISIENGTAAGLTIELHPDGPAFVEPQENGCLIHTNHFLAPAPAAFDTEPKSFPDTVHRHQLLSSHTAKMQAVSNPALLKAMANHVGGSAAICCHHDPASPAQTHYETLSTIVIDLAKGTLLVHAGGPCSFSIPS